MQVCDSFAKSFDYRRRETIRPVDVARVQLDPDTFVQSKSEGRTRSEI